MEKPTVLPPVRGAEVCIAFHLFGYHGQIAIDIAQAASRKSSVQQKFASSDFTCAIDVVASRVVIQVVGNQLVLLWKSTKSRNFSRHINDTGADSAILLAQINGVIDIAFLAKIAAAVQRYAVGVAPVRCQASLRSLRHQKWWCQP